MKIDQVIQVLEEMEKECHNAPDMFGLKKMIFNAPAIFSYETNYKQALTQAIEMMKRVNKTELIKIIEHTKWVTIRKRMMGEDISPLTSAEDLAQVIVQFLRGEK